MKKVLAAGILSFLMSFSTASANEGFEGIWKFDFANYWIGCHVNNSEIVCFGYGFFGETPSSNLLGERISEAYVGAISGNIAHFNFVTSVPQFEANFVLISPNILNVIIVRCATVAGQFCPLPAGSNFNLTKIFD